MRSFAGVTTTAPGGQLGLWLGSAGLLGGASETRLQSRRPERRLRHGLGALAVCLAIGYLYAVIVN